METGRRHNICTHPILLDAATSAFNDDVVGLSTLWTIPNQEAR